LKERGETNSEDRDRRYLPLHTDQSSHSFVLALNQREEYEGGGTYFADLGATISVGEIAYRSFTRT